MTEEQVTALGPAFGHYLREFRPYFVNRKSFAHLGTYCRGLISDLARKSVEPIALLAGTAVRTLQQFLTGHVWDQDAVLARLQRRIVERHLPAPGRPAADDVGTIGIGDETSQAKKGEMTPGVQRQYCGSMGKVENCIVTVHLAVRHGTFLAMLDSDLYIPDESWDRDRERCAAAHIPDDVAYRPKWVMAIEQVKRAVANGVRFDWLTYDEGYGSKPEFLFTLDGMGQTFCCEVPTNFMCWPTYPTYDSHQRPYQAKRVDNAAVWGKPFRKQPWQRMTLARQTLGPQFWDVKAGQVHLQRDGQPTDRTYWLVVARNVATGEVKHFVSNAPPHTPLETLMKVAFSRWGVEHAFRVAKTEVGFGHFEGRSWLGLLRHMILCQVVMLFVAEETGRLRGEKSGRDDGAGGPGIERDLRPVARPPPPRAGRRARGRGDPLPPAAERRRPKVAARVPREAGVAL
jgi:SRSO17 transposase